MSLSNTTLIAAAVCTGLMAGLFYSYSCSVINGLGALPDASFIAAMQSINRAIQNPLFFTSFFGAPLLLLASNYLQYTKPVPTMYWIIPAATITYLAGTLSVTIFGNIPLNNALEKFDLLNASKEAMRLQRNMFEASWNRLNTIRTISSILSFILIIIACFFAGKAQPVISK